MPRDLVIDGYNLLHAAGFARRSYGPGDLERARRNLLRLIAEQMSEEQRRRTTFVFDAKDPPPAAGPHGTHAEMLVLYAQDDEEADDLIERIIAAHSAPRQLIVVSSDHRLHKAARRRKSVPLDSDAFLDECARRVYSRHSPRPEPELKPGCDTSPAALEEWLAVFDIDPQDVDVGEDTLSTPSPPIGRDAAARSDRKRSGEPRAKRRNPAAERESPTSPIDDVAFWEARIADLIRRNPEKSGDEQ